MVWDGKVSNKVDFRKAITYFFEIEHNIPL
jgi:hypothetical protein